MKNPRLKTWLGACVHDLPRGLRTCLAPSAPGQDQYPWIWMRNRNETLEAAAQGPGARCCWEFTSRLHLAHVIPAWGRLLLARCLRDFPVRFSTAPRQDRGRPQVCFVIGHRGRERLPLLLATLASIAAQEDVRLECVVVEQDSEARIAPALPSWVRCQHDPPETDGMPYSRARAFNRGVALARAPVLILHDNDMPVPAVYARETLRWMAAGFEVVNLKRFIFYLDAATSQDLASGLALPRRPKIDFVRQNLEGGGSVCITRQAYQEIGGFDERFIGWGGEDNEFWERAQTRRARPHAYLPLLHLWHAPQPEKTAADQAPGVALYRRLAALPVEVRIQNLVAGNREEKR